MSVEISWYLPGKIIFRQYSGEINENDIITINESLPAILEESQDGLLYSIDDLTHVTRLDVSLASVRMITLPKGRLGWSIMVLGKSWEINRFTKFMGATAAQMLGIPLRTASSIEEAVAFLKDVDPKVAHALDVDKLSA